MKRNLASRRIFLLFLASLSIVTADNLDHILRYRQVVPKGTGASASTATSAVVTSVRSPTSEAPDSSSTPASDPPETTAGPTTETPDPVSDRDSTSTAPTEDEEPSTPSVSSEAPEDTPTPEPEVEPTNTTDTEPTLENTPTTSAPVSPPTTEPVRSRTTVVVRTVVVSDGGTSVTSVLSSTELLAVPGSAATSRGAPRLDGNEDNQGSSGLKDSERKVIIGTVVGIGGAILLGGIAFVIWRVWGKKKHATDDDRDLMDSQPGSSGREKRSSVSGPSPFRSTLDQYHNPAKPVNTASNF